MPPQPQIGRACVRMRRTCSAHLSMPRGEWMYARAIPLEAFRASSHAVMPALQSGPRRRFTPQRCFEWAQNNRELPLESTRADPVTTSSSLRATVPTLGAAIVQQNVNSATGTTPTALSAATVTGSLPCRRSDRFADRTRPVDCRDHSRPAGGRAPRWRRASRRDGGYRRGSATANWRRAG